MNEVAGDRTYIAITTMGVTRGTPTTDRISDLQGSDNNETAFERFVENKMGVCSNCFTRTHDIERDWYPHNLRSGVREMLQREKFDPRYEEVQKVFPPEKSADYPPSRNICECGVLIPFDKVRPLKKQELLDYTHNVVDRLEESDVDFNEVVLFDEVRQLKEDPECEKTDDDILEHAVHQAIHV